MYIPSAFNEADIEALHARIRAGGLATLVSMTADGLIASHAPLFLLPEPAPYGTLVGHLAKANPHALAADAKVQTLAIFQGAEGYISPAYYAAKAETGKVVPTWNYVAVHAYGTLETFDDPDRLLEVVTRLTNQYEAGRAHPWAVGDAPADFVRTLLRAVVGVSIRIDRLEGKTKMSQNRPAEDHPRIIEGLRADGQSALADAVAKANG